MVLKRPTRTPVPVGKSSRRGSSPKLKQQTFRQGLFSDKDSQGDAQFAQRSNLCVISVLGGF